MPRGIRHFAALVEIAKNQTLEFWHKSGAAAIGSAQAAGFLATTDRPTTTVRLGPKVRKSACDREGKMASASSS
jgi:hypothetical protein